MNLKDVAPESGIYTIECLKNNRVYVGQSVNIMARWHEHASRLLRGNHGNKALQQDFDKFGIESFEAEIVQVCPRGALLAQELYWAKYFYDSGKVLYNFDNDLRIKYACRPKDRPEPILDPRERKRLNYARTEFLIE